MLKCYAVIWILIISFSQGVQNEKFIKKIPEELSALSYAEIFAIQDRNTFEERYITEFKSYIEKNIHANATQLEEVVSSMYFNDFANQSYS